MRPLSVFIVFILLFIFVSCSPAKKIISKKDISTECKESLMWLYNSLEKSNGILKVRTEIFKPDESFRAGMQQHFYNDFGHCLFKNLTRGEVIKLYGKPKHTAVNIRSNHQTYYYFIASETCRDTIDLKLSNHGCGMIRFTFTEDGKPIRGMIEL